MTQLTAEQWIIQLLLGGILGMVGQGSRVVIGLKKLNDEAQDKGKEFGELFQTSTLLLSLLIGFIAGTLAILAVSFDDSSMKLNKQIILTLIAAGYAGTDFIEGFMRKYLPSDKQENGGNGDNGESKTQQPAMG